MAGPLLPAGLRFFALALSLSACAGVSLLLSRLAVRETCVGFEGKLARLRKSQEDLLERMIAYGEAADRSAYGGIALTRNLARLIALRMGLNDDEASAIGQAAAIHDLGKVGVPSALLNKPSRLTLDEFELVKEHTVIGPKIIGASPGMALERDATRHHHERWDGTGYPDHLEGEAIPLVARITSVADVFEALITRRPYKEPWPLSKAVDYLRERAGSQFDPQVVDAFAELYVSGSLPLPAGLRSPAALTSVA